MTAALVVVSAQILTAGQQTPLPTVKEIVARHVAAIGGEAAVKSLKSMRVRGRFEMAAQGISGDLQILSARPNKMLQTVDISVIGHAETGYDGKVGWSIDPQSGPSLLSGRELMETTTDAWFEGTLHGADHVREMTLIERTDFAQRPAYKVNVVFKSGHEQIEYFDVEAGWQIGAEGRRATSMGVVPTTVILRDYKKFGPLMQPTTLVQRAIGIETMLRIGSCEYDVVPANAFDIPPQVKALIK